MKKLSDYLDPTLWCLTLLALALVWQLVVNRQLRAENKTAASEAASAYKKLADESQEKQRLMQEEAVTLADQFRKEREHDQINHMRLVNALRTGAVRLSVPVRHCAAAATGTDSTTAGGDIPARAELTAEAATSLTTIAIDGDNAIKELNTCIAAYNQVRERMNVQTR